MKKRIKETVSGDNRGEALIMTAPFNVTSPAFSPRQLSLEDLPDPAIARIAGAIGTPPMVLGLPDPGKTYSNLEEAIRSAWGVIVSMQELVADSLRWDLFPDFGIDPQANVIEYDYSQIQEYQESLDAMWGRVGEAYKNGVMTRNEGRELIGYDADPDGDVYYPGTGGGAEPKVMPGFPPQGAAPTTGAVPPPQRQPFQLRRVTASPRSGGAAKRGVALVDNTRANSESRPGRIDRSSLFSRAGQRPLLGTNHPSRFPRARSSITAMAKAAILFVHDEQDEACLHDLLTYWRLETRHIVSR